MHRRVLARKEEAPAVSQTIAARRARSSPAAIIGSALLLAGLLPAAAPAGALAAPTELFISEYVEGSSNNKAIEIFNGTGSAVNLATDPYALQMFFNGSATPGLTITLTGTVASGDVYVVAQATAAAAILAQADQTNGSGWFNGDDAVALVKGGTVIDAIGQVGFDPGTEWGAGLTSTMDNTLRRKAAIEAGDTDPTNVFDPAVEWDGFASDTFDGLGNTSPPPPPAGGGCGDPATPIHDIQGSGPASPLANGTPAEIEGVVVGDYQAFGQFGGFHVQEEDAQADADPATSEGIFVSGSPAVSLGDVVHVNGQVLEFSSSAITLTEITNVTAVEVCSSSASVTPAAVSLPFASTTFAERYEGMLVDIDQTLTVTETFTLGRFGEAVLSSGGRLINPTAVVEPGVPAQDRQAANDRNRIVLDDGNNQQNIDPTRYPQGGLTAANTLRIGDTLDGGTFVLEQRFGVYRLQPVASVTFQHDNGRPAAPAPVGGNLRVSAMNVLNYFTTLDTNPGSGNGPNVCGPAGTLECRGANTALEFQRQRDKIISALVGLDADVVGLMEIENNPSASVADLVAGLNAALGAGTYAFIDTGTIGTDAIKLAIIYKPARVTPVGAHAILDASVDPRFRDNLNRPSLAQTFERAGESGRFTVVVNHLKSKGSDCNAVGDPDTGDGSGNCNVTRTLAAQALVDWIATDPTASGDADVLVIGDMNAYARENPIDVFVNAGYINLIEESLGDEAYSFVFQGQSGYLDHALASPTLAAQVAAATEWHVNADEPIALDYNTDFKSANHVITLYAPDPFRSSDHDPLLVGSNLLDFDFALRAPFRAPPALNPWITPVPLPVLFTLGGDKGRGVLFGSPITRRIDCTSGLPTGDQEAATALLPLVYDRRHDTYSYVWRTKRAWAGTCRTLELAFDDGTTGIVRVRFVRNGAPADQAAARSSGSPGSAPAPPSGSGSGIRRSLRTGDSRTGRNVNRPPIAPTHRAARVPNAVAISPPTIIPIGIVPHTMKRIVAFIRPSNRSGVIAWRRLTWFTLYTTFAQPTTIPPPPISTSAVSRVASGTSSPIGPLTAAAMTIVRPMPIQFATRPAVAAPMSAPAPKQPPMSPTTSGPTPRSR
jgi:predicted extracellular nuclease